MFKTRRMTQEEITKAFENRWRIKGFDQYEVRQLSGEDVKRYCRDFFETAILIASSSECQTVSSSVIPSSTIIDTDVEVNGFDFFWNAYEKKVGRPKCEKLWEKLTLAEKRACLDYIPLYKQAQPDKQYRKNPETFLRNKSWNDEIIPHNNGNSKPTIDQQRFEKLADILTQ